MWASSVLCCLKHVSLSVGNTVQASRHLPGGESSPSRPVTLAKGPPCSDTSSSSLMTPAGVWGLGCEPVLLGTPLLLSHSSVSDSVIPRPVARQAPLSTGFSREECWSGLPLLTPRDLLDAGIKPTSPALAGRFFTTSASWEGPPLMHLLTKILRSFFSQFFRCEGVPNFLRNEILLYKRVCGVFHLSLG